MATIQEAIETLMGIESVLGKMEVNNISVDVKINVTAVNYIPDPNDSREAERRVFMEDFRRKCRKFLRKSDLLQLVRVLNFSYPGLVQKYGYMKKYTRGCDYYNLVEYINGIMDANDLPIYITPSNMANTPWMVVMEDK